MASDTIDAAIEKFDLKYSPCITDNVALIGTVGWSKNMFVQLIQHFGLETEVATHLSHSYGTCASEVAVLSSLSGSRWPVFGRRLVTSYPYIDAEVRYACRKEYACTAIDVLARRLRLAFLNAYASREALPRVIEIMSEELGWDAARQKLEYDNTILFLKTMGLVDPVGVGGKGVEPISDFVTFFSRATFLPHELERYRSAFNVFDSGTGTITKADLGLILTNLGIKMSSLEIDGVFGNRRRIEFSKFLDVLARIKELKGKMIFKDVLVDSNQIVEKLDTDRSGGGV